MMYSLRRFPIYFSFIFLISFYTIHAVVDDITGNTGSPQSGSLTLSGGTSGAKFDSTTSTITQSFDFVNLPVTTSSVGQIKISNQVMLHAFPGEQNIFVGGDAGGSFATSGTFNTGIGDSALNLLETGNSNTAIGHGAGVNLIDGSENTFIGDQAATNITSGFRNILIGLNAGSSYTNDESDNIIIGNNTSTQGESNTIRIGGGQVQQACYIDGIYGISVDSNSAIDLFIDDQGKIGTISSTAAIKENIRKIGNDSERIFNLRPVSFNLKSDISKLKQYGLIAEEVNEVMPELVVKRNGEPFAVRYHELPVLILNELKEMQSEIRELKKRIRELEEHHDHHA